MGTTRREELLGLLDDKAPFAALMRQGHDGMTDSEYLWEPVAGCWSIRPARLTVDPANRAFPEDDWDRDIVYPDPSPAPFTTIAWRMSHLINSMFVAAAALAGRRRRDGCLEENWPQNRLVARTAAAAASRWEEVADLLRSLAGDASEESLDRPERVWWAPQDPAPVFDHVVFYGYFEPASHGAEVRLLRDLYRHTEAGTKALVPPGSS